MSMSMPDPNRIPICCMWAQGACVGDFCPMGFSHADDGGICNLGQACVFPPHKERKAAMWREMASKITGREASWTCPCGFVNKKQNKICGGTAAWLGCKEPRNAEAQRCKQAIDQAERGPVSKEHWVALVEELKAKKNAAIERDDLEEAMRLKVAIDQAEKRISGVAGPVAPENIADWRDCPKELDDFILQMNLEGDTQCVRELRNLHAYRLASVLKQGSATGARNPAAVIMSRIREASKMALPAGEQERLPDSLVTLRRTGGVLAVTIHYRNADGDGLEYDLTVRASSPPPTHEGVGVAQAGRVDRPCAGALLSRLSAGVVLAYAVDGAVALLLR
eukprot:gene20689-40831_t